jgi:hypothetical protein
MDIDKPHFLSESAESGILLFKERQQFNVKRRLID